MALFVIPNEKAKQVKSNVQSLDVKLKKGQTIDDLIQSARKLVTEKLGKYDAVTELIRTKEELEKFFIETEDLIAVDTETTGLNTFTDRLVGISLSNGKRSIYIPVSHKDSTYNTFLPNQMKKEDIQDIFKRRGFDPKLKWLYHNAKFDLAVFRTFLGFKMPNPMWDTYIGANLLFQDEDHNLKYLYNKYVAIEDEGVNKFDKLFAGITFDYIPLDISKIYAAKDALMTYELYKYQESVFNKPEFSKLKYVMTEIEMPLLPILEDMHRDGISMNTAMLQELYNKYNAKLQIAEKQVYQEIEPFKEDIQRFRIEHYDKKLDDPILLSSPSQLSILFYDILKYKTKSGKGTGVNELQEINTPLTNALLEYRKMQKLIDAFLIALPKQLEPSTNKIHTSLNQYGAATRQV